MGIPSPVASDTFVSTDPRTIPDLLRTSTRLLVRSVYATGAHFTSAQTAGAELMTSVLETEVKIRNEAESTSAALDLGVNFLDTADMYGPFKNEEVAQPGMFFLFSLTVG